MSSCLTLSHLFGVFRIVSLQSQFNPSDKIPLKSDYNKHTNLN